MPDGFERSAFIYKDLREQPAGKFCLLLEPGGGKGTFIVDGVEESQYSIIGYRGGYQTRLPYQVVVQFSKEILWTLVNADYIAIIPMEEMIRREHADGVRFRGLAKELQQISKSADANDKIEDTEEEVEDPTIAGVIETPISTGQYL